MSFPQFIPQQLGESSTTTLQQVIRALNGLFTALNTIFTYLFKKVQLDSVLLQKVSLTVGSNQVPHTLGRVLTGYTVTRLRSQADVWDAQDSQTNPTQYLTLISSADVVVDLVVF